MVTFDACKEQMYSDTAVECVLQYHRVALVLSLAVSCNTKGAGAT